MNNARNFVPCMCGDSECPSCGQSDASATYEQWANRLFAIAYEAPEIAFTGGPIYGANGLKITLERIPCHDFIPLLPDRWELLWERIARWFAYWQDDAAFIMLIVLVMICASLFLKN